MMERGEIYICAQKGPYSGKPRAMVIVQANPCWYVRSRRIT